MSHIGFPNVHHFRPFISPGLRLFIIFVGLLKPIIPPPLPKTNMTRENPPFEDVFPIENGDFSNVILVFRDDTNHNDDN